MPKIGADVALSGSRDHTPRASRNGPSRNTAASTIAIDEQQEQHPLADGDLDVERAARAAEVADDVVELGEVPEERPVVGDAADVVRVRVEEAPTARRRRA